MPNILADIWSNEQVFEWSRRVSSWLSRTSSLSLSLSFPKKCPQFRDMKSQIFVFFRKYKYKVIIKIPNLKHKFYYFLETNNVWEKIESHTPVDNVPINLNHQQVGTSNSKIEIQITKTLIVQQFLKVSSVKQFIFKYSWCSETLRRTNLLLFDESI